MAHFAMKSYLSFNTHKTTKGIFMIRMTGTLQKKLPNPAADFGSIGASLSLEIELSPEHDIVQEADRLYRQLSIAVDAELARQAGAASPTAAPTPAAASVPPSGRSPVAQVVPPVSPSAHPRPSRRGPALVTASQLRLLGRLLSDQPDRQAAVLAQHQVQALDQLTCRQASEAIDQLKGVTR